MALFGLICIRMAARCERGSPMLSEHPSDLDHFEIVVA
jgi:hypothetical protein